MILLLILQVGLVGEFEGKPLPPVIEPDWGAWKDHGDLKIKSQVTKAWHVLRELRPDQEYRSREDLRRAEARVDESYATLDAHPQAACAVGIELLRITSDDWQRLMIASAVASLGGEKGKPFLNWAMALSKSVDETFEAMFETACRLAEKRRPEFLPAMFLMLRAREGSIFLPLHSWHIPTHDCMFYVFGRYGRDVIPYLYRMLKKDDPYLRRNAAFVLGYFMDKQSVPALLKMLDANDVGSGGAAFALGELGHVEAAPRIARLLRNRDGRTRFWGAYALYELGSEVALPELEDALKIESDKDTRMEIEMAIEHIRANDTSPNQSVRKLTKEQLQAALKEAVNTNGLEGDVAEIAASAGLEELATLENIRLKSMKVASDRGHKRFRSWSDAIKTVRRRCD